MITAIYKDNICAIKKEHNTKFYYHEYNDSDVQQINPYFTSTDIFCTFLNYAIASESYNITFDIYDFIMNLQFTSQNILCSINFLLYLEEYLYDPDLTNKQIDELKEIIIKQQQQIDILTVRNIYILNTKNIYYRKVFEFIIIDNYPNNNRSDYLPKWKIKLKLNYKFDTYCNGIKRSNNILDNDNNIILQTPQFREIYFDELLKFYNFINSFLKEMNIQNYILYYIEYPNIISVPLTENDIIRYRNDQIKFNVHINHIHIMFCQSIKNENIHEYESKIKGTSQSSNYFSVLNSYYTPNNLSGFLFALSYKYYMKINFNMEHCNLLNNCDNYFSEEKFVTYAQTIQLYDIIK